MMNIVDIKTFIQQACQLGAVEAKIIEAASIVTAAWVRLKCQFGCAGYNTNCCCPPHTPTPQQTRAVIDCYTRALLIHCKGETSPTRIVTTLEREIFLQGFYKALGFGAGPCRLCQTCDLEQCVHPEKTRPAMEACGIDVYATVRANGYPLEVLSDYSGEENYYGLILID
jgi:predicted metal-binding protein